MSEVHPPNSSVLIVGPHEGRAYEIGALRGVFLADGAESDDRYCVSTWWLDAHSDGPGAHAHDCNEELFFVIDGTMSFLIDTEWIDAPAGTFVRIPPAVVHDFANRTDQRAGALNVFIPGGFESDFARWATASTAGVKPGA